MARSDSEKLAPRVLRLKARLGMVFGGLCVVAVCVAIRCWWGTDPANADPPRTGGPGVRTPSGAPTAGTRPTAPLAGPARAESGSPAPASSTKIVAVANGEPITREQLGLECLRHYGKDVLETMVNKYLISQECKRQNVVVTRDEVNAEIDRMAQRFKLTSQQWLTMLKQERGINPGQYAADIVWPTQALRRLAGERLKVTEAELREAYDTQYGPAVRARLIACNDLPTAQKVRGLAADGQHDFGELAKEYSQDASASVKGVIQPIRKHGTFKEIEQAAFTMKDGEVSQVIPIASQFVILKRDSLLPGAKSVDFNQVRPQLEDVMRERKMRTVAGETFVRLQKNAKVENVLNDPVKSRAMPGVAAVINGHQITMNELAEQCIDRYGELVLEGTINRKLLEQACKKRNLTVTQQDVDREIERAAAARVPPKPNGSPDVESWLKLVTEQEGVSLDVYRNDQVWPSVALKKLVGGDVKIAEEDLKKGYEANYGPRVRCRAIVMNNARRAQKAWEEARQKPTVEHFGNLAEQYSIEPGSQALRGEVPPIRRHGGQPRLEEEAYRLKPGELSGIIQVDDKFVILFCEGLTKPVQVSFAEVREEIFKDIHEKKLRLAMAEHFEKLQETATIDNYLAGTTQSPTMKKADSAQASPKVPMLRQAGGDKSQPRSGTAVGAKKPDGTIR